MANRLQRDQIINRALDMIDSATLDNHDRPAGTVISTAYTISWLQDAIDAFYHQFPWSADVITASLSLTTGAESPMSYNVPATFLWDVRNGIIVTTGTRKRLIRKSLQEVLSAATANQVAGPPEIYTVVKNKIYVHPRPDSTYSSTIWYYAFPAIITSTDVPPAHTDLSLIEYVRLRGLEWIRALQPGSAQVYLREELKLLREGALGREPEASELPNDPVLNIKQSGSKTQLTRETGGVGQRGTSVNTMIPTV